MFMTFACVASPTSQSINLITGVMDVDLAAYLSKHDVVFNQPISNPEYGSTVGNGRIGAMVWEKEGLNMQISGVDASEQTAFSAGTVRLGTAPAMGTSYSKFQQRLNLYDGILTVQYDANRTITVMGLPHSEVLGIHVSDSRSDVSAVTLDLGIWDVSKLTGGDVPNIDTWKTVNTSADAGGIALSRGQDDRNNFGYTLGATVQGASFKATSIDSNTVRLLITPSSSYTIWIVCASRLNAPNHDSITQANALLKGARATGYETALANFEDWWHAFWQKSFVQYSLSANNGGNYLENLYYLYTYIIAAGSYANYPFHFINGDFNANGDANSTKWGVAYWYWNERDVYSSFLTSNHPDIFHTWNRLYTRNFESLAIQTRRKYGIEGIWVPETMGWDGNSRHTDESAWTRNILSTGTEAAENIYAEFEYTDDADSLRSTVYPFVKAVAQFYTDKLTRDTDTDEYYVSMSNAHETYWGVRNAITDLAAIRSLFPIAIKLSQDLRVDGEFRSRWKAILDKLAPYPIIGDGSRYAPHDPPATSAQNGENITSELIWPYGVTGIGASDYSMALDGWKQRPFPDSNIWSADAIQAARLGLGDEALKGMRLLIEKYQTYPNGLTDDANGRFEYLGTLLSAINESLMQSYNHTIRVFPAPPGDPAFVGRFTLLAKGGFLVSSEYEKRDIKYVAVKSLYGNPLTIENPWGGEQTRVRRASDRNAFLTTAKQEFGFDTTPNVVYIIDRPAKPLRHSHIRLTGAANRDAKRLTGSQATLGAFPRPRPGL